MEYIFEKYRVNGNDYLVFDVNQFQYELSVEKIRRICHHHFGVGLSGLIMGPYFKENSVYVRIFGTDGIEERMNGTAICAFAQFLREHAYITKEELTLETLGGLVEVEFSSETQGNINVFIEHGSEGICTGNNLSKENGNIETGSFDNTIVTTLARDANGKESGIQRNHMTCLTGKARQTGKVITADHFIQWL